MSIFIFFVILIIGLIIFAFVQKDKPVQSESEKPSHVNTSMGKYKITVSNESNDVAIQELRYFCVKDKGYHASVWPKDYRSTDIIRFDIAGVEYRDNIDEYLGESVGVLQAEPTNRYDANAIKILATDGHHVGYVPRDMTTEVREAANLPCPCFFYIGKINGIYFSDCYILRPNVSPK